jgi:Bacterial Ig-like domain/Lamin Tail Domain
MKTISFLANLGRRLNAMTPRALALIPFLALLVADNPARAVGSTSLVISQIYGGGGNASATFTNDFLEIHNISTASISLAGKSLQYASATSTATFSAIVPLSGNVAPGGYFLVMLDAGPTGAPLPITPDLVDLTVNFSASGGQVALCNTTTALTAADFTGTVPTGAQIIDFVGNASGVIHYEGAARAATPGNITANFRANSGTTDTNQNATDFTIAVPNPRNSATAVFPADIVAPLATLLTPLDDATGVSTGSPLMIRFNEAIAKSTGNVLVKLASTNATVFTIPANAAAVTLSPDLLTVTIALPSALAGNTAYYITVDGTAFKDLANNNFAGISAATAWNFTTALSDGIPPIVTALSPADNSTNALPTDDLTISYNESILPGSGNALLKKSSDNSLVESLAINGPRVSLSGMTVTLDPTAPLQYGTGYYVELPSGAVTDLSLNPSPAISGSAAWNFTTRAQPSILISQYYEGTGTSRYIELKNLTASPIALDNYRLSSWSPTDPAGNQGWKSGTATTPRVTTLIGKTIPANGYFLVAANTAATPEYAAVNNDLIVTSSTGATAFSGAQSIVLYSTATNDLPSVADAVSIVATEGTATSFYRLNDTIGFDFALGSSVLDYSATWGNNKTLPEIETALITDAWYLRASHPPENLTLSLAPASISEGAGANASTATVTRSGSTVAAVTVTISLNDPSEATAPATVTILAGAASTTFPIAAVNDPYLDGPQAVLTTVTAPGYLSARQTLTVLDQPGDAVFPVVINEVDTDQAGADTQEFVELYNNSAAPVSLSGVVLVFYNGGSDLSYRSIDLTGQTISGNGFLVIGTATVPSVDLTFPNDTMQNGPDAVALYLSPAVLFPNGTTTTTPYGALMDAVVYNNGQTGGASLVSELTPGQPQVNENAGGNGLIHAIARIPNGGLAFTTSLYLAQLPTPGASNGGAALNNYNTWAATNAGGQAAALDFDNDGTANGVEYFYGSNNSAFTPIPQLLAGVIAYPISATATGATYQIQTSPDLVAWGNVTADLTAPGFVKYTLPTGQGKLFTRLQVTLSP